MAEISNNGLFCVKNTIENFQRSGESTEDIKCIVVSIRRYTSEPQHLRHGQDDSATDLYDIVLHDGNSKQKFALNQVLNCMITSYKIYIGCSVSFNPSDCDIEYDETCLTRSSVLVLNQLTPVSWELPAPIGALVETERDTADKPLLTGRGSYLSLSCNQDPVHDIWYNHEADEKSVRIRYDTIGSVKSLSERWKNVTRKDYLPLLVRVLHRSRLRYYGRPDKANKWPYQAFLEVADHTGTCSLVLWNVMCPELYTRLTEGTLVYIEGYTVKKCYELMSRASLRNPSLHSYSLEIGVNKHHPKAEVVIVRESRVPSTHLPRPLSYHFLNKRQLSSVPDKYNVDIVGVVVYIGRCQRLYNGKHGFWLYRWLELLDGSSSQPIRVELFATSQPKTHRELDLGRVLVSTQMRVVHGIECVSESRHLPRTLYVTTTNQSQTYVHSPDDVKGPYSRDQSVVAVQQWSQSEEALQVVQQRASVGGYYNYPWLPRSLEKYREMYSVKEELKILSSDELQRQIKKLEFREFKRVHFQGFIAGVCVRKDSRCLDLSEKEGVYRESENIGHTLRSGKTVGRETRAKRVKSSVFKKKRKLKRKATSPETDGRSGTGDQCTLLPDVALSSSIPEVGDSLPSQIHKRKYRLDEPEDRRVLEMYVHTPPEVYIPELYTSTKTLADLPRLDHAAYLSVQLTGLHRNIRLNATSVQEPTLTQSADLTLQEWLSGQSYVQSSPNTDHSGPSTSNGQVTSDIRKCIATARQLENKRMLFVLDLFSYGREQTEITLNRAYLVPE